MTNPPLWKASVTLAKELAADVAAVLELSPPTPQAVLIVDELFKETATVEALYSEAPDADLLSRLTGHRGERRAPARPGLDQAQPGRPAAGARGPLLRLWRARCGPGAARR